MDQLVECFEQAGLLVDRRLVPAAHGALTISWLDARAHLCDRLVDRRRAHPRRLDHAGLAPMPQGHGHGTRHDAGLALVQVRQHRVEEPGQFLRRQLHTATLRSRELTYGGPLRPAATALNRHLRVGLPGFEPGTSASRTEPGPIWPAFVGPAVSENIQLDADMRGFSADRCGPTNTALLRRSAPFPRQSAQRAEILFTQIRPCHLRI